MTDADVQKRNFFKPFAVLLLLLVQIWKCTSVSSVFGASSSSPPPTRSATRREAIRREYDNFGILHTLEDFTKWSMKDEQLYSLLSRRLDHLEMEADLIKSYIKDYDEAGSSSANAGYGSTIESHLMISRYVNQVKKIRRGIGIEETTAEMDPLLITSSSPQFPTAQEDLYISSQALIHIQEIHGYLPEQIYEGLKIDTNFGCRLTPEHRLDLGVFAVNEGYYAMGIEWLEFTERLLLEGKKDQNENDLDLFSISGRLVKDLLVFAIKMHNFKGPGLYSFSKPIINPNPTQRIKTLDEDYHQEIMLSSAKTGNDSDTYMRFLALCKGHTFQEVQTKKSNIKCYLERKIHPYFILSPVKTEKLSEYPFLVVFHDVLGENLIQKIYNALSFRRFSDTVVLQQIKESIKRRSSVGFRIDEEDPLIDEINRKSEILTGLRVETKKEEALHIVEYSVGRYSGQHKDTYLDDPNNEDSVYALRKNGNRLATLLYYLEEPVLGGETPFTQLGISVTPTRGSVVFWLNLFRNGTVRPDITHGACPVLHGHKIVINRWIGYGQNFQRFQCSPDQNV